MISFSWAFWQQYQGSFIIYQWHTLLWCNIEVFQTLRGFFCYYHPSFSLPPLPAQATLPSRTSRPDSFDSHSPAENKGLRDRALPSSFKKKSTQFPVRSPDKHTGFKNSPNNSPSLCSPYYLEENFLPLKFFPPGLQLTSLTERGSTASRVSQSKLTELSLFSNLLHELKQE